MTAYQVGRKSGVLGTLSLKVSSIFCQGFYSIGSLLYVAVLAVDAFNLSVDTVALLQVVVLAPVYLKIIPLSFCDRYPIR